jgi:hypothetical protein
MQHEFVMYAMCLQIDIGCPGKLGPDGVTVVPLNGLWEQWTQQFENATGIDVILHPVLFEQAGQHMLDELLGRIPANDGWIYSPNQQGEW